MSYTTDRLGAALSFAALKKAELAERRARARISAYETMRSANESRPIAENTVVIRITKTAYDEVHKAWPDKKTRASEISKLLIIGAGKVISSKQDQHNAQ